MLTHEWSRVFYYMKLAHYTIYTEEEAPRRGTKGDIMCYDYVRLDVHRIGLTRKHLQNVYMKTVAIITYPVYRYKKDLHEIWMVKRSCRNSDYWVNYVWVRDNGIQLVLVSPYIRQFTVGTTVFQFQIPKFRRPLCKIQQLTAANFPHYFPHIANNFLRPLNMTKYAVFVAGNCKRQTTVCLPNKPAIFQISSAPRARVAVV